MPTAKSLDLRFTNLYAWNTLKIYFKQEESYWEKHISDLDTDSIHLLVANIHQSFIYIAYLLRVVLKLKLIPLG